MLKVSVVFRNLKERRVKKVIQILSPTVEKPMTQLYGIMLQCSKIMSGKVENYHKNILILTPTLAGGLWKDRRLEPIL